MLCSFTTHHHYHHHHHACMCCFDCFPEKKKAVICNGKTLLWFDTHAHAGVKGWHIGNAQPCLELNLDAQMQHSVPPAASINTEMLSCRWMWVGVVMQTCCMQNRDGLFTREKLFTLMLCILLHMQSSLNKYCGLTLFFSKYSWANLLLLFLCAAAVDFSREIPDSISLFCQMYLVDGSLLCLKCV